VIVLLGNVSSTVFIIIFGVKIASRSDLRFISNNDLADAAIGEERFVMWSKVSVFLLQQGHKSVVPHN
jgi:hypothetical protein